MMNSWTNDVQLGRGLRDDFAKRSHHEPVYSLLPYLTFRGVGAVQKNGGEKVICTFLTNTYCRGILEEGYGMSRFVSGG